MDKLDFDPGQFTFTYPLWVCILKGRPDAGVMGGSVQGGGKFLAVFTDEDLARRYLDACGKSEGAEDAEPADVPDRDAFASLLRAMRSAGFSHVVLDDPGKGGEARLACEIPSLLRAIRSEPPEG